MSPEQMLAQDVDERSDLFSLGVCAYYALTSAFPYPGATCAEIGYALSRGTFLPPSAFRPGLPRTVDAWFEKAIAVRAEERFKSPVEMLEAFRQAIEPGTRDTPVSVELDLPGLHTGWPSAVWKTIGVIAAVSAVLVTVHASMVERRATRALAAATAMAVDTTTRTTSARMDVAPAESVAVIELPDTSPPPTPVATTTTASLHKVAPVVKKKHMDGTEGFGKRE
jgi:serine/threonine protein kinase